MTEILEDLRRFRSSTTPGQPRLMLVDARRLKSLAREARQYFAGEQSARNTIASAIVIASPLGKMIANLFMRLSQPPFPTRLFSSETNALIWLRQFQHQPPRRV